MKFWVVKRVLLLFIMIGIKNLCAQILQDVNGRPYFIRLSEDYEGSPLLFQTWVKANVVTAKGKVYENVLFNIDISQNQPLFLSEEKIYTFSDTINRVTITNGPIIKNYKRVKYIHSDLPDGLVEVLSDSLMIFKKDGQELIETSNYGGKKSYRYTNFQVYYAVIENQLKKILLTKENAKKVFVKQWSLLRDFVQRTKVSFKNEDGWLKMIEYYSSLK